MNRFNILDHFLLSGTLFSNCVDDASVIHSVDNTSDHDPILLKLKLDAKYIGLSKRVFTPRVSWVKASDSDLVNYRANLSCYLSQISIPVTTILCCNPTCQNCDHVNAVSKYADDISNACLAAGEVSIPHTCDRKVGNRIPGWSERIEPLRQKSLFWHDLWIDCGRPRSSVVADCMLHTRAAYHCAIRQTRKNEDSIVRERIAEAMLEDPTMNFWAEIKKIRNNKAGCSRIVDDCTDENSIAQLFASKYKNLYTSVPYDVSELNNILSDIETDISQRAMATDFLINSRVIQEAINKLNLHKSDGSSSLSSDHFVKAGSDLSVHISFLFTAIVSHGSLPRNFVTSTVIPIPKKRNAIMSDSDNFRGISLSSIYGKIFDNVILLKYSDKLCTSDLQFGFRQNSSTNMCTMILKETVSYYVAKHSSVFCTFLDASKASIE
jgi:hypothetical protein